MEKRPGELWRPAEGKDDLRGARGGRADSPWPKSRLLDDAELVGRSVGSKIMK